MRELPAAKRRFTVVAIALQLGLSPEVGGAALGDGLVVGLSYLLAAIVPLWPYVAFARLKALPVSVACTLLALFALGVFKGRIGRQRRGLAGTQVLLIGSVSAAVGFGIGHLVTSLA